MSELMRRRDLTGTLIEGSNGVKHRQFRQNGGPAVTPSSARAPWPGNEMSIEIDVLNGNASWPRVKPLMDAVWTREAVEKLAWGHVKWAHADLRVLIDAPEDQPTPGLACHVGIHFRDALWDGRKVHIGGIGGVATRADCRGRGYATVALNAAIRTLRDHEAVRFALLFCEPHNYAF